MTSRWIICLAAAAGFWASASPVSAKSGGKLANCPITRTIYALPGATGVTAGFSAPKVQSNYATDLVFWLKAGGQTFWYRLSSPNGYGGLYITPQRDPAELGEGDDGAMPDDRLPGMIPADGEEEEDFQMMFDAFDASLTAKESPPTSKDKAPAYLFARELGPLFHYAHAGGLYKLKAPVYLPVGLWRPVRCQ